MKTSELEVGKSYRPKSAKGNYYKIIGIGYGGCPVYQSFNIVSEAYIDTGRVRLDIYDWEEYDPTPESRFFNVYVPSNADRGADVGTTHTSLEKARMFKQAPNFAGTVEVVKRDGKIIRTIWHDNL